VLDEQVLGEALVADEVGDAGEREPGERDAADREAVEAVGQVDRVGRPGQDQDRDQQERQPEPHAERQRRVLEDREVEARPPDLLLEPGEPQQRDPDQQGADRQRPLLLALGQAVLARDHELDPVVDEADDGEPEHAQEPKAEYLFWPSNRIQSRPEISIAPTMKTPPIVGVRFFFLCSSASCAESVLSVFSPMPALRSIAIARGASQNASTNEKSVAATARNEMYWSSDAPGNPCSSRASS
jgi:hypothetical protein